jgi:hypothetical protein
MSPIIKGSLLRVRLDDDPSKKYLALYSANRADPLIGLLTPANSFVPLRVSAKDGAGRTLDTAIPLNTQLQLLVHPGGWQLADEKGAAVGAPATPGGPARTASVPVMHTTGSSNPDIKLKITGVR